MFDVVAFAAQSRRLVGEIALVADRLDLALRALNPSFDELSHIASRTTGLTTLADDLLRSVGDGPARLVAERLSTGLRAAETDAFKAVASLEIRYSTTRMAMVRASNALAEATHPLRS